MYVSYLRVSSPGQVDGDGFDRQRETIERWRRCRPVDLEVAREFCERGVTGAAFERPQLAELLVWCREMRDQQTEQMKAAMKDPLKLAKQTNMGIQDGITVLVERSDRLARENLTAELILREFRALDVKVVDCEAGIELTNDDDPSKVLIRQILQAVSEFEKSSIVKKLKRARDRKRAETGRCDGAKPYGHYEDEKLIFNLIKYMHGRGVKASPISRALNAEGYKTRRGTLWNRGTVYRICKRLDQAQG